MLLPQLDEPLSVVHRVGGCRAVPGAARCLAPRRSRPSALDESSICTRPCERCREMELCMRRHTALSLAGIVAGLILAFSSGLPNPGTAAVTRAAGGLTGYADFA